MVCRALGLGCERAVSTIRPQPARGHLRGEEQAEATQATGDDVGAVAAEDSAACAGGTTTLLRPPARDVEHELAGVLGALIARIAVAASANG